MFFLFQARRLDVVGDEVAAGGRNQQIGRPVGGGGVDIRRRPARGPGKAAHLLQKECIEVVPGQQVMYAF